MFNFGMIGVCVFFFMPSFVLRSSESMSAAGRAGARAVASPICLDPCSGCMPATPDPEPEPGGEDCWSFSFIGFSIDNQAGEECVGAAPECTANACDLSGKIKVSFTCVDSGSLWVKDVLVGSQRSCV